jgi:hypothetical protein
MKDVLIVGGTPVGACQVRGYQTSQALDKYCSIKAPYTLTDHFVNSIDSIKDTIIIFAGEPIYYAGGESNLQKLHENGNILIYDIIDNFCFQHSNPLINTKLQDTYQYLDVMLHPNSHSQQQLRTVLPNTSHTVIPHQWDIRNEGIQLQDSVTISKAAYIGGIQGGLQLDIAKIVNHVDIYDAPLDVNQHHLKYGIQVSFRKENSLEFLYKPCTKLAMASSFKAILLTSKEPAVVDILGEDYTFYIHSEEDLIDKLEIINCMSDRELKHHRNNTQYIKDYLSPEQNARRYNTLIQNYV